MDLHYQLYQDHNINKGKGLGKLISNQKEYKLLLINWK